MIPNPYTIPPLGYCFHCLPHGEWAAATTLRDGYALCADHAIAVVTKGAAREQAAEELIASLEDTRGFS